jgi:hypothetical protein
MNQFQHAEAVESLIQDGRRDEAVERHNLHVKQTLARARAGERINLTDLIAAKQILIETAEGLPPS